MFGDHIWQSPVLKSWLCAQGSLMAELREPYMVLGMKPQLALCKASACPPAHGCFESLVAELSNCKGLEYL